MKRQTRHNRNEKQYGYLYEIFPNYVTIGSVLENALEHNYGHNIGNDVNGWFVPLSCCVVDIGDGSLFDVIGDVIKCMDKFLNDYPLCLLFVFCVEDHGWFVFSMKHSETCTPTDPCFSLKEGKIVEVNPLWKLLFECLAEQTSGYKGGYYV